MAYSTTVTYILWLFFGWLGIHHLYLGRLNHAIVWFATLGGGCGVGWLRDLWRIPSYVEWANADPEYQRRYLMRMQLRQYPSCSIFKFVGLFVMGLVAAIVFSGIIPQYSEEERQDDPNYYYFFCHWSTKILYVIGSVLGVYLVGNIGETTCTFKTPFKGCMWTLPWVIFGNSSVSMSPLVAGLNTRFRGLHWRQLEPVNDNNRVIRRSIIYNLTVYSLVSFAWITLICIGFYFNATVTVNDERIPLRVALSNFFKSDAWIQTKDSLKQLYIIYREAGWERMYKDLKELFDLSGEGNAYRILGLNKSADQNEIDKKCRQLSREYHPDKKKDPEDKIKAQEKFIEVQQACSTLSASRTRRAKSSSRSEDKDDKRQEQVKGEKRKEEDKEEKRKEEDKSKKEKSKEDKSEL